MKEKPCYRLSPSQDVSYLQCRYTLFKRVINILSSVTLPEKVDYEIFNQAYKLLVKRNDCLRIKFFKKKGQLMQYFEDYDESKVADVPVLTFETKEKQDAFIDKTRKKPIKYMSGIVIEPRLIHTYEGKDMIFLKVCHLCLDVYGIHAIYMDLLDLYNALKNGTPLPEEPSSFEKVIIKDIERSRNQNINDKHLEFFTNILNDNPEPYYAGIHGPNNKIWQKKLAAHHRGMQMFFINCDTMAYRHKIDRETVDKVLLYCRNNQCSPANLLFFAFSVTQGRLNGNVKNLLPLSLYNCRVSALDKNCAGSKVQSGACYTKIDYNAPFEDNLKSFSAEQMKLYRHVNFSDRDFETLLHTTYRSSYLETYYSLAFSLVPFDIPEGIEFDMYTNGKGALPNYVIQFLNAKTNEIDMAYDVQTKITTEEDVRVFHSYYVNVINQVMDDPRIKIGDIKLSLEE